MAKNNKQNTATANTTATTNTLPSFPKVAVDNKGMHLSLPSFKSSPKWDKDAEVIYPAYAVSYSEATSHGAKNTIMSETLAGMVQAVIFSDAIRATDATLTGLSTAPDEETEAEKAIRLLTAQSLRKARKEARDACPAVSLVDVKWRTEHPHPVFLAAIIGGRQVDVQWGTWFSHVAKCEQVLDKILQTVLKDGSAVLTDEQRAIITAGKDAVKGMFSAFTEETAHNRKFNLRVLDADIIDWYKMSGIGYSRKGTFKTALTPKQAEKSPLCKSITSWLFGKIRKEYTEE